MDLSSLFKPRTAASSRFRPFYGEKGGFPWGYSKEGTYGPGIERQPMAPGEYALMSDIIGDVKEEDIIDKPQKDVTAGAPEIPFETGGPFGGYEDPPEDPPWEPPTDEDPYILGEELEVRRGYLPEATPTFSVHNPYYYDEDQERERWYSGSYGWRLPGGPHYSAPSGGYNPYQKWGGVDMLSVLLEMNQLGVLILHHIMTGGFMKIVCFLPITIN